jgi:hypothetical protein
MKANADGNEQTMTRGTQLLLPPGHAPKQMRIVCKSSGCH